MGLWFVYIIYVHMYIHIHTSIGTYVFFRNIDLNDYFTRFSITRILQLNIDKIKTYEFLALIYRLSDGSIQMWKHVIRWHNLNRSPDVFKWWNFPNHKNGAITFFYLWFLHLNILSRYNCSYLMVFKISKYESLIKIKAICISEKFNLSFKRS